MKNYEKAFIGLMITIAVIIVAEFIVNESFPPEQKLEMTNITAISWGYETKYNLNITAPKNEATHYTTALGSSYIYFGDNYYDLNKIPQNRIITIHRTGVHEIRLFYWVEESNGYYQLVGMGVYQ